MTAVEELRRKEIIKEELKQKAEKWVAKYVEQSVEVVRKVALRFHKHLQEAYIAGATENGIVWHDLRKDPNDLPKEDRYYLIFTNRGNYYISKHHHNTNYWIGIQNQYVSIKQVIAWCEIPQFKE